MDYFPSSPVYLDLHYLYGNTAQHVSIHLCINKLFAVKSGVLKTYDVALSSCGLKRDLLYKRVLQSTVAGYYFSLFQVCMEVAVCLVQYFCTGSHTCGISPYSIVVYSHAGLWFLTMLVDRYV